eukprot:42062-Eustigmatos_ZCMA.PRE.1
MRPTVLVAATHEVAHLVNVSNTVGCSRLPSTNLSTPWAWKTIDEGPLSSTSRTDRTHGVEDAVASTNLMIRQEQ